MKEGEVLRVRATDPGYERDLLNWAKQTGNEILSVEREGDITVAYVRKRSGASDPSILYWIRFHALGVKLHLRLFLLKLNPFRKKPDHFITFTAISEGTRADRFLKGRFGSVLLPIPDEIDPRCGVVLALRGREKALEVYRLLRDKGFGVESVYRKEGKGYVRVYP
ncbi:MAG: sulfurtransferase TusA family protein [Aquificota bacterium]|nr:sulfurtransferase TusA family protein [Aquificota bacterium]